MNKEIMKLIGFSQEVELVEAGKCPFCKEPITDMSQFRNEISRRENQISGLCQTCQDKMFGKD